MVSIGNAQHKVNVNHLLEYGGLKYMPFSEKPFSGKVFELYDNGEKHWEKVYKNGVEDGYYKSWYPNSNPQMKVMLRKGKWHGKYTFWYENSKVKEEIRYSNGVKNGKFVFWNEDGVKIEQGHYNNGRKHGLNFVYHDDGSKQQQISYRDGQLHGQRKTWYENANVKEEARYINGKLDGVYSSWSTTGAMLKQKSYQNGRLHGPSITWWYKKRKINGNEINGPFGSPNQNHFKKEEANYSSGMLDGIYKSWLESGILEKEIHYSSEKLDGPYITWWPNGNKKEEINYRDDQPDGAVNYWYMNGQKKEEYYTSDGKKNGIHNTWFQNGQKKYEHTYKKGRLNGKSSIWYSGGQKKESGIYKNGKPSGYFTYWNENGQRREEGNFNVGEKEGLYTYWHENGQKRQEILYKKGKRHGKTTVWWQNGQKKKEGLNKDGKPVGEWDYWSESGGSLKKNSSSKRKQVPLNKQKVTPEIVKEENLSNTEKQTEGSYVTLHDNGMIKEKGKYVNGKKEGEWRSYNSKGQILQLEIYSSGKIEDLKKPGVIQKFATYHDNGRVKAQGLINNGERDGEWKIFNQKGDLEKVSYFDFGELVVERDTDITKNFISYHDNGRVKEEGKTFHGHRDGKWNFYNENGQLTKTVYYLLGQVVTQENPDDLQEFISYHDNGRLKEKGITKKNIRAGEWKMYNSKGDLSKIVLYENGQIIIEKDPDKLDDYVTFHDNGRIKEQGQTYMGHRDGKWKFYNEKGELKKTILYLVGDVIDQDTSL
tara:strand:- start:4656 stop:6947 length:2292 start_codon:yes stop_codon:yes gene_type:complete